MKSVISVSRRTDIPAFYLKWFMEAIKAGQIEVTNPLYRRNSRIVKFDPDHVHWIVFWSRNYAHFLRSKDFFKDYQLFFHFTILPKTDLEKSGISLGIALDQIKQLSQTYGPERIIWRYDPIVHWIENKKIRSNHDPKKFESLCRHINSLGIKRCYFSFVQSYQKYQRRFAKAFPNRQTYNLQLNEQMTILDQMIDISSKYNIVLYSCSNDKLLENRKIQKGHCINGSLLNKLDPSERVSEANASSRQDCGCTRSIDIGDYINHPCHYGCIYCYANPSGY